jgi:hypothetical protein
MATAQPTVVEPRVPQVRLRQLKPFTAADGDLNRVSTKLSDQWAHRGHCPTHCGGTPGSPSAVSPAQTIHGCRRRWGSVLRQLSDLLVLPDMRAVLVCKCQAEEWYDNLDFDIWASGNEWSVEADASCLFCRGEQPRRYQGGFPCFPRTLKRECRRLFCVEFSRENHASCLLLRSAQERLTLSVFWVALSSERCVCGFVRY